MLKRYAFILLCALLSFFITDVMAGGLRGRVVDEQDNPVPGVSIFIAELITGTSTNNDGVYEVRLTAGNYNLSIQSLGFSRQDFKISVEQEKWIELNVVLRPVAFQIREVRIYSGGEDPAYAMMRKAIGLAPYYLRQARSYEAEVYLRGSLMMDRVPRLLGLEVNGERLKSGQSFAAESLNRIRFAAPDTFHHTVLHSRSSFSFGEEASPIGYITSSVYDPSNEMFISPLSSQAMRHYRFRYEGFIEDGDLIINRIRVIPRRKSQQLLEGELFLVDGFWNVHSLDFTLNPFFGKVRMQQVFAPVRGDIWLPINHRFNVDLSTMGVKGRFDYVGSVKYLTVEPDQTIARPSLLAQADPDRVDASNEIPVEVPPSKNQQQIERILEKEEMSNRDMIRLAALVEKEASVNERSREVPLRIEGRYRFDFQNDSIRRDSLFWSNIRPVPLTITEHRSFARGDSLLALTKASTSSDTLGAKSRFAATRKLILYGGSIPAARQNQFQYGGLIDFSAIGFNPVDGWRYRQQTGFVLRKDSAYQLKAEASLGYAFARRALFGRLVLSQRYAPLHRGIIQLEAGSGTSDYKGDAGLFPLVNMASSLLFKENYTRYYGHDFVSLTNQIDLMNGLVVDANVAYHRFAPLQNQTNYSFFNTSRQYHPNQVNHSWASDEHFKAQDAFVSKLELSYTPQHHYMLRNGRKVMLHSKYPTFKVGAEHGASLFGSSSDYFLVEGGISKQSDFTFQPSLSWGVSGGLFLRNNKMHFSRFKHFAGSAAPFVVGSGMGALYLVDDYELSTASHFLKGDLLYSTPWLALKYLPIFSNRLWNEDVSLSYLHTPERPHYVQVGYGISRIFMVGSLGLYAGFDKGRYQHLGLRVSISGF